ncbi:MAG: hypothetical protein K9G60_01850 [Pseudolabrys sp.]|nr:hypothetical protein [Pseudolabrys sp.]
MDAPAVQNETKLPIVWGNRAIAAAIGRTEVQTRKMLAKGCLRGAVKVQGRYALDVSEFKKQFQESK